MATAALALKSHGIKQASPALISRTMNRAEHKTITFKPDDVLNWPRPPFQRPLNITADSVIALARAMMLEAANDKDRVCLIPGDIMFGRCEGVEYMMDGQHRVQGAFLLAAGKRILPGTSDFLTEGGVRPEEAIANAKIEEYDSMAEMAEAFRAINGKLVAMKSDDDLRAMEFSNPHLLAIREACPFIDYQKDRATKGRVMTTMSMAIRTWFGSGGVPAGGPEAKRAAQLLDERETRHIIEFFSACERAGWVSQDCTRLWSGLNIGINMWLWRKLVLGADNKMRGGGDFMALSGTQYSECMKALCVKPYMQHLVGKSLRVQDRLPTYEFIQELFLPVLAKLQVFGARFPVAQGWGRTIAA